MKLQVFSSLISAILLFVVLINIVDATPVTTESFQGDGVAIEISFPEEAHPEDNIFNNITIVSNDTVSLRNFTANIKILVDTNFVEVFSAQDTFIKTLPVSYNLPLSLPQGANGNLHCLIYVNTTKSNDYLSFAIQTTKVSALTFDEFLAEYNSLSSRYSNLVADYQTLTSQYEKLSVDYSNLILDYETLLNDYDILANNQSSLIIDYEALLNENVELTSNYNDLLLDFEAQKNDYNKLLIDYNDSLATFDSLSNVNENLTKENEILNSTYNLLLGDYKTIQTNYDLINSTHVNLQTEHNILNSNYNLLLSDYNNIQTNYNLLNSTHLALQLEYNQLQNTYTSTNNTYTNLYTEFVDLQETINRYENDSNTDRIIISIFSIAVGILVITIMFLIRKKQEPYMVIRKETVALKKKKDKQ